MIGAQNGVLFNFHVHFCIIFAARVMLMSAIVLFVELIYLVRNSWCPLVCDEFSMLLWSMLVFILYQNELLAYFAHMLSRSACFGVLTLVCWSVQSWFVVRLGSNTLYWLVEVYNLGLWYNLVEVHCTGLFKCTVLVCGTTLLKFTVLVCGWALAL